MTNKKNRINKYILKAPNSIVSVPRAISKQTIHMLPNRTIYNDIA